MEGKGRQSLSLAGAADFEELAALLAGLIRTNMVAGAEVAIYDPEVDAKRCYARPIVDCLARGFAKA